MKNSIKNSSFNNKEIVDNTQDIDYRYHDDECSCTMKNVIIDFEKSFYPENIRKQRIKELEKNENKSNKKIIVALNKKLSNHNNDVDYFKKCTINSLELTIKKLEQEINNNIAYKKIVAILDKRLLKNDLSTFKKEDIKKCILRLQYLIYNYPIYKKHLLLNKEQLIDAKDDISLTKSCLDNNDIELLEEYAPKLFNTAYQDITKTGYFFEKNTELYNLMYLLVKTIYTYRYNYHIYHLNVMSYKIDEILNSKKNIENIRKLEKKIEKNKNRFNLNQITEKDYNFSSKRLHEELRDLKSKDILPTMEIPKQQIKNFLIGARSNGDNVPFLIGKINIINEFINKIKNNPSRNDVLNHIILKKS